MIYLSQNFRSNVNFTLLNNLYIFDRLDIFIHPIIKNIDDEFDAWKGVLNCRDIEEFNKRKETFLSTLLQIKEINRLVRKKKIALQPLNEDRVYDFKLDALRNWKSGFSVLSIFELFNAINIKQITIEEAYNNSLIIGYIDTIHKENFVDDNIRSNISQYGTWAGEEANTFFLESIILHVNELPKEQATIESAIVEGIRILKEKQLEPNIIILPLELSFKGDSLDYIENFERVWVDPSKQKVISQIGSIGNILVVGLKSEIFKNSIIISDFSKAFSLEIFENEKWMDKRLIVEVKELNQEQKERQFVDIKRNDPIKIDSETNLDVENLLNLEIGCLIDYRIINKEAFVIIPITEAES